MTLVVRPAATADLIDALVWLAVRKKHRLIRELARSWDVALERIEEMPRRCSPLENAPPGYEFREYLIPRFRYRVIFRVLAAEVRVLAFVNARQDDRAWRDRITLDE